MFCYSEWIIESICKVPWKLQEDSTSAAVKPWDSSFPEDLPWLSPGEGILANLDIGWSQCGRSFTLELPHMGITAKLGEVWAPAFKPFHLSSQETISDRALKYKQNKRGSQILLTLLAENIFPGQRIWRRNVFSGAEPQTVRHSMSFRLHSMTLWSRSCKCSKRQEQMQPFIYLKAAQTPAWRSPMCGTKFIQHLQPSAH